MSTKRVIIIIDLYCRMSFGHDGTVFKCEDQERQGRADVARWAAEQGPDVDVQIGKVLYDHALSAWKPKVIRPSFNEVMDRLESGVSHGVWVRDVDRFTRKMAEAVRICTVAKAGAYILSQRSRHDFTTARGIKRFYEDAVDAEYESNRISERTRDGLRNKALRGKSLATTRGFARPGYAAKPDGWEPGDLRDVVPAEQVAREVAAVRDAVERILAGEAMNVIAKEWNAAGLLTTKGGLWDTGILRQMLERPALTGLIVHKGEIVGQLPDDVERPLDRATWDRLQAVFKGRKSGRTATVYLLSGIARCAVCGNHLYGRPLKFRPEYADEHPVYGDRTYRQYWCQPRTNDPSRCGKVQIDQRQADRLVEEAVLLRLGDKRHVDRLNRRAEKMEAARVRIAAELHHLDDTGKGIAAQAVKRGYEWVDAAMAPIDARREELNTELARLKEADTDGDAKLDATVRWETASMAQRRTMVKRAFPDGLFIRPGSSRGDNDREAREHRFQFGPGGYSGGDEEPR